MTTTNEMPKEVSVIGLGAMGSTIARLMIEAGYRTTVWNRTDTKADALVQQGAVLAPNAADAIDASPTTIICVYDYAATNNILQTEAVAAVLSGRTLIQLTTGSPQEARDAEAWVHQHGAKYLDGALQVAPDQMAQPDTTILLSGADDAFKSSEPLLRVLGGNLSYLGEQIGAASAMDLATLSCLYGMILGFFHGATICEKEGFDVGTYGSIVAAIAPSFGEFLKHEGNVIQSGDFAISQSPLRISVEATERMLQIAQASGLNLEFPRFADSLLKQADAAGYSNEELAAVVKVLRPAA
jgi:3-hydroxyisobutyrate dehydrogenase-like beta-hydroxyacid dehydrogenase